MDRALCQFQQAHRYLPTAQNYAVSLALNNLLSQRGPVSSTGPSPTGGEPTADPLAGAAIARSNVQVEQITTMIPAGLEYLLSQEIQRDQDPQTNNTAAAGSVDISFRGFGMEGRVHVRW